MIAELLSGVLHLPRNLSGNALTHPLCKYYLSRNPTYLHLHSFSFQLSTEQTSPTASLEPSPANQKSHTHQFKIMSRFLTQIPGWDNLFRFSHLQSMWPEAQILTYPLETAHYFLDQVVSSSTINTSPELPPSTFFSIRYQYINAIPIFAIFHDNPPQLYR